MTSERGGLGVHCCGIHCYLFHAHVFSEELPPSCTLRDSEMGGAREFVRTHFIQQPGLTIQGSLLNGLASRRILHAAEFRLAVLTNHQHLVVEGNNRRWQPWQKVVLR